MLLDLTPLRDRTFVAGLILLGLSLLFFLGLDLGLDFDNQDFGNDGTRTMAFFAVFALFWGYFIAVAAANKQAFEGVFRFHNLRHNLLLLQLANVSAYTLNKTIPVFEDSTDWLTGYLAFYHLALLLYCFRKDDEPDSINTALLLTFATGTVFHFYQAVFVYELYPFAVVLFWFFGISLLALVPLWQFGMAIHLLRRYARATPDLRPFIWAGIFIPLVMVGVYTARWIHIKNAIQEATNELARPLSEEHLPPWVLAATGLQDDLITERALKSGVVYQLGTGQRFWGGNFSLSDERSQHDPLVVMASAFAGKLEISDNTRLRLLNTLYDNRHQTEPKLWRGENLITESVTTHIQLFPAYRLSYTEQTIDIGYPTMGRRWGQPQEALYTFHLPEGAVVSSAALWVNGQECPALLTTRAKADSAYRQIVGVEVRDPLLIHWQEGNRVTARIFPVEMGESRRFKIGFTAPLAFDGAQLVYPNIDFQGPVWNKAQHTVEVVAEGDVARLDAPWAFREDGNTWRYDGPYTSDWQLQFDAPPLATYVFTFNGRGVQLRPYTPAMSAFAPSTIYLDVHRGWTRRELDAVWAAVQDKPIYVFTNKLEQVTPANQKRLFKALLRKRYSLFPFYRISDPARALVVTHYSGLTPNLGDLKPSEFATRMQAFMEARTAPVALYNLGDDLSPYLRTLRDLRLFHYAAGDTRQLADWLAQQQFDMAQEDSTTIIHHGARLRIQEVPADTTASAAPDHLLRMLAYNDLLKQVGKHYFQRDSIAPALIDQASEAHIVTPISSMVVLETQADYDRFDIQASKNSLGNATLKSAGGIPEPHEWALLLLSLLLMGWVYWRK